MTFSPRGDLLAGADGNGQAYLWDLVRWMPVGGLAGPGSRGVNGVAFGPRGDLLAAADSSGQVYLWQTSHLRRGG